MTSDKDFRKISIWAADHELLHRISGTLCASGQLRRASIAEVVHLMAESLAKSLDIHPLDGR